MLQSVSDENVLENYVELRHANDFLVRGDKANFSQTAPPFVRI
jgi:hypothetical protein